MNTRPLRLYRQSKATPSTSWKRLEGGIKVKEQLTVCNELEIEGGGIDGGTERALSLIKGQM